VWWADERVKGFRRLATAVRDVAALKSAARAALVMPTVFGFADKVIQQSQTSIFAAFGSFAFLVLVEFTGPARTRLVAYVGLACVGAVFVTVGTLCSRSAWLAAVAMGIAGFATLFAGVFSDYAAAGATGALLAFVLPVTLAAPNTAIPERLEGWALAAGVAICALMLLWPPRRRADFQRGASEALRAVADLLDAGQEAWAERARVARASVEDLGRRLLSMQHGPTGPTGPMAALASLPDELDWLLSFVAPEQEAQLELACAEDREAMMAAAAVLRASADRLEGRDGQPDFERLEKAREAVAEALRRRLPELPPDMRAGEVPRALDAPFRIRALTYAARQAAAYGLLASGVEVPELDRVDGARPPRTRAAIEATERLTIEHASVRSVWFRNSLRGAVGLALAVYVAQRTGLQHGFWVVLGTLSVLRSNALNTGRSIVGALVGTAIGIVVGAVLVIGIGTHEAVLWGVLPVAVFLAAYAPRAISFAAGQAGFTVVLIVLFNIIQPVGWTVGLVRVEDVAIGFAVSLVVGLLFWPRGAATLLLEDLATAYARGADYVVATARRLSGGSSDEAPAGRAVDAALHRLDDAFRQYLAERSATAYNVEDVAALVGGAWRVRRAAQSLAALGRATEPNAQVERCAGNLDGELQAFHAWYTAFGAALVERRQVPSPHLPDTEGRTRLLTCVRAAAQNRDKATVDAALFLLWSSQHLENLWRLETHLAERVNAARATASAHV
jgi:Fusaric acid resistance protein-like